MNFYVMTLFPEMVEQTIHTSITGRAMDKGLIRVNAVNIRDYTTEKHGKTDDYPYGGGAGMVMQVQPVHDCYKAVCSMIAEEHGCKDNAYLSSCETLRTDEAETEINSTDKADKTDGDPDHDKTIVVNNHKKPRVLYMSPQGRTFDQDFAKELAQEEELVFLCGHYEGIDERALELLEVEEVSIGDFILTGGELPAVMMIDCISRLVPGVLGGADSAEIESFHDNLLEYPQYSRPEDYNGLKVPEILLSGHHANVEKWRREQSIIRTLEKRPDLIDKAVLNKKEQRFLHELLKTRQEDRQEDREEYRKE